MTLKERMATALNLGIPDAVPTFELEFQLEEEMFGTQFDYNRIQKEEIAKLSKTERNKLLNEYAEHVINIYVNNLEYSSIPMPWFGDVEGMVEMIKLIKKKTNDSVMIHKHGDGTYELPDGNGMYDFAYRIADDFDSLLKEAENRANNAIESNKKWADAGIDLFILCADYCYNSGPFISPKMFSQLITPYLAKIVCETKKTGAFVVKHTDGNIMPILDQLIECKPHAIHSLDPMAGIDIAVIKKITSGKVAICGNVNCALMQTGTDEEVLKSCEYAMTNGKPNGGYVFTTSNVPFKGLPAERYQMVLDYFKAHRYY